MGLMLCAEAEPVEEVSETALLCTRAYSLIARRSLDDCPGEKGMPGREAKQWKTFRRRMQLAEAGNWQTLVKEALADAAEARDQIDTERFVGQAEQDPAEEERRRRSGALHKVKHDFTRTAAQLFRGQCMLPASAARMVMCFLLSRGAGGACGRPARRGAEPVVMSPPMHPPVQTLSCKPRPFRHAPTTAYMTRRA